jgi:hypothetical protein
MKTEESKAASSIENEYVPVTSPHKTDEPSIDAASPRQPRPWHPSWIYAL